MPKKLYVVDLTPEERAELLGRLNRSAPARKLTRARALLLADEGRTDEAIADVLDISRPTTERLRKRFVNGRTKLDSEQRESTPSAGAPRVGSSGHRSPDGSEFRWIRVGGQ